MQTVLRIGFMIAIGIEVIAALHHEWQGLVLAPLIAAVWGLVEYFFPLGDRP